MNDTPKSRKTFVLVLISMGAGLLLSVAHEYSLFILAAALFIFRQQTAEALWRGIQQFQPSPASPSSAHRGLGRHACLVCVWATIVLFLALGMLRLLNS